MKRKYPEKRFAYFNEGNTMLEMSGTEFVRELKTVMSKAQTIFWINAKTIFWGFNALHIVQEFWYHQGSIIIGIIPKMASLPKRSSLQHPQSQTE